MTPNDADDNKKPDFHFTAEYHLNMEKWYILYYNEKVIRLLL